MSRRPALLPAGLLVVVAALGPSPARAAGGHDPEINWRTVDSPRFRVHYPEGGHNLALRISRTAEVEVDRVARLTGNTPRFPIEIVLLDNFDGANGSANVLPRNVINVRLTAPTELTGLSSYDDWLRILLIHELAHVCDIDQTSGFTALLDRILGPYVRTNGYAPQFLTEGYAVYVETALTATGRGRSSYIDMTLRMAALEDDWLSIDRAHLGFGDWPGGSASYYYGGMFHLWLAERYGHAAVAALHSFNAAMPVPYMLWNGAKSVFGDSLPNLWEQWRLEELEYARSVRDRVQREGETVSRRITFHGRNIAGAMYHPTGDYIIYSRSSPVDGSTIRRVDRDGSHDTDIVPEAYSSRASFGGDGKTLYLGRTAINERFNTFSDLYRFDLEAQELTRLRDAANPGESLRAREPDVTRDGRHIVFVQNRLNQSWISIGRFHHDEPALMDVRVLVPPHGDQQAASPRFSPDGDRIAVSIWFDGGKRDMVVVDATSGALVRRLTFDRWLDGNPVWSPDGAYLLYESDASGISNIYAYEWDTRRYYQVTNVVGGAFNADVSPDGRSMLFRNCSGIGFDIHEIPFDPSLWWPVSYDPERGYVRDPDPPPQDDSAWRDADWGVSRSREQEPAETLRTGESDREYFPEGMIPFNKNWILIPAAGVIGDDPSFSVATFLTDTLGEHAFSAALGTSVFTGYPNWGLSYVNDMWYPTFSVGVGSSADSFTSSSGRVSRSVTGVAAGMGLPIKLRHNIGVSYSFQHREGRDPLSAEVLGLGPHGRRYASVSFGYGYSRVQAFPYSVSPEKGGGVGLGGRWYSRQLGGEVDELLLTFDGRAYINNPLFDNHVLALRLTGAVAFGPEFLERFSIGGVGSSAFFAATAAATYPLRGFGLDVSQQSGTGVVLLYLDYRFPIWQVEHGLWLIPVYIDKLSGSVFAEGGNIFGTGEERDVGSYFESAWQGLRHIRIGGGAEVAMSMSLGWGFPLRLRLGLAVKLADRGRWGLDGTEDVVPYLAFGGGF